MFRGGSAVAGVVVLATCLLETVSCHGHEWMMEMDHEPFHDHDSWRDKRVGQKMCGDKLINSLMIICDYKYNKRGQDWMMDPEESSGGSVWRARNRAVAMLSRVRRGVVDECCSKPCSIKELSSYCLAPSAN